MYITGVSTEYRDDCKYQNGMAYNEDMCVVVTIVEVFND